MSYSALAPYLRPGHPIANNTDTSKGTTYAYLGPTDTLETEKPAIGATWADGLPVKALLMHPLGVDGSGVSELIVSTSRSTGYSGTIGTAAVEETYYGLTWRPFQKPLEVHPEFQEGGSYGLDEAARACVMGWRAEVDVSLRAAYKYAPVSADGSVGAEVNISAVSPNALKFIQMLAIGVEEFTDYLPVWRRRRIYHGSNPPIADAIGNYDGTPPEIPAAIDADYYFVKSADNIERIGTSSKWRRDEEWEGAVQVFCDRDHVYPSGNPEA